MDISSVNINFNAVNRGAFTSSSDEPDAPDQAQARVRHARDGVAPESELSLVPPTHEVEEVQHEEARTLLRSHTPHRRVNVRV